MIVGYAGSSDRLDVALARFARLYADQTEADHAALVKAADQGVLPIERGLDSGWVRPGRDGDAGDNGRPQQAVYRSVARALVKSSVAITTCTPPEAV